MKISITCTELQQSLSDIKKSCGASIETISIKASKKACFVSATNKINVHIVKLPSTEILEAGECTLPVSYLEGVIRNRKGLLFTLTGSTLNFESTEGRKYKGEITALPYEDITIETPEDVSVLELDVEQVNAINFAFNKTVLPPSFEKQTYLPVRLKLDKHGIEALCYDNYYMARCVDSNVKFSHKVEMQLMGDTFSILSACSKGQPYTLAFTSSVILAYNKNFKVLMPYGQDESTTSVDQVNTLINDLLSNEEACGCTVNKEEFSTLFYNAYSFQSNGQSLKLSLTKKALNVGISTAQGSAKEAMLCTDIINSSTEEYNVGMTLLEEFISKIDTKDIPIRLTTDALLIGYENKGIEHTFVCGLS